MMAQKRPKNLEDADDDGGGGGGDDDDDNANCVNFVVLILGIV